MMLKGIARHVFSTMGYKIVKITPFPPSIDDELENIMDERFKEIYETCENFTMTSVERMYALYKATEYVVRHRIPGDIVECGVWRGGSCMLCALTSMKMHETQRKIYLYDTFEGMSEPTKRDISYADEPAKQKWNIFQQEKVNQWCYASLDEVQEKLFSTGYPKDKLIFVKGDVRDTIPGTIPDRISLLRLDTDWYDSTHHELYHLFPLLSVNGVIIIDDYGFWKGARDATDQYFEENGVLILLNRIDYTGRIGIKVSS